MVVGALAAALLAVACTAGHAGLGRKACPYLRPRLFRLDGARRNGSNLDLSAVDEDIGLYVRSQLPAGGKATRDQALVRFSAALDRYVRAPSPATGADLTSAEAAVKRECHVG